MALGMIAGAGALAGALGGMQGDTATQTRSIGGQSSLGRQLDRSFSNQFGQLEDFASVFGRQDVEAGRQSQLDLASMLQQFAMSGGMPTGADIAASRNQAQKLFSGQRAGLANMFQSQTEDANRQAARLGRSTNDPILQAQLRRSQIGAERELMGQEQALTQQLASSLPLQRLGFQQQRAGVLSGLGNQATTLRSNLLGIGSNLQNLQNQIRLGQGTTTTQSGGGLAGALSGAVGGAGAASKIASFF